MKPNLRRWRALGSCAILCALISLIGCGDPAKVMARGSKGFPVDRGFLVKSLDLDGHAHKYSVFIPRDYDPAKPWPAIVFLHGIGESGDDGKKMLGVGLGPEIAERVHGKKDFELIAIFPQSDGSWKGEDRDKLVIAVLDQVCKDYSVDPDRVALTGLSTGGYGTWTIGADHKDRFAALIPMCAYAADDRVDKLKDMPIWCFHNNSDWAVGSGNTKSMIEKLRQAGGNPKFTRYKSLSHDCWTRGYAEDELWDWILAQSKSQRAATRP